MSGLTVPVTRWAGRAIVVGSAACRSLPCQVLARMACPLMEVEDPYAAMLELCRRPASYRALVLSLRSIYREELAIIQAAKGRFPSVEIWLAHTDGQAAALAEAMRMGADGLLSEDGLHRFAVPAVPVQSPQALAASAQSADEPRPEVRPRTAALPESESDAGDPPAEQVDPILTAEELKALLEDRPD
jgi:hypothetical protein